MGCYLLDSELLELSDGVNHTSRDNARCRTGSLGCSTTLWVSLFLGIARMR